jgi:hypothetical protein
MSRKPFYVQAMRDAGHMLYERSSTPWGPAQHVDRIADDIEGVSTAGHGGIKLSAARNRKVPDYMRRAGGWYEEDCEYAIPFIVFEAEVRAWATTTGMDADKAIQQAKDSLKCWGPDAYEKFFGVTLKPGESYKRDEERQTADHVNDFITCVAWGDWHETVPKGMVGVAATRGKDHGRGTGERRYFLVPEADYQDRDKNRDRFGVPMRIGFVVDPARHKEWLDHPDRTSKEVSRV